MKPLCLVFLLAGIGCAKTTNDQSSVSAAGARHLVAGCGPVVPRSCPSPMAPAGTNPLPDCAGNFSEGDACSLAQGAQVCVLDPGHTCANPVYTEGPTYMVCSDGQQLQCPVSKAKFKEDIKYLSVIDRQKLADGIIGLKLTNYKYKQAYGGQTQLGFIIDDLPPASPLVQGEHVNMYGYISSVVATVQAQDREIRALKKEIQELKKRKK